MSCLEHPHGLRVFETFAQSIDENGVKPVNAIAMLLEHLGSAGDGVGLISQGPNLSV